MKLLIALALALTACGTSTATTEPASSHSPPAQSVSVTPYSPPYSPPYTPPAVADPKAQFTTGNCDYVLGNFTSFTAKGYRFIAATDVTNIGNIGVVIRATAHWKQLGTGPVTMTKTTRIPVNGHRTISFTKPVGQDEIDLIQAEPYGKNCSVGTKIVDTFGSPTA